MSLRKAIVYECLLAAAIGLATGPTGIGQQCPANEATTVAAHQGQYLFPRIGCSTRHVQSITTAPAGTVIDWGMFTVPEALRIKIIHPFGDFLLHDVPTGDCIVQVGPQNTADQLRTAPLWGPRIKARFTHDLKSLSLENAI